MRALKFAYWLFLVWAWRGTFILAVAAIPERAWNAMFCRGHYGPTTWEKIKWGRDPSLWRPA